MENSLSFKKELQVNYLIGNWKMNGSRAFCHSFSARLNQKLRALDTRGLSIVICPPFSLLRDLKMSLKGGLCLLGAQDVSIFPESGPYTGDVSSRMLADQGCTYALVGHSERRKAYGETDLQIAQKAILAQEEGICPIICVGENHEAYVKGQGKAIVRDQIDQLLSNGLNIKAPLLFAYEPIWSIGTRKMPCVETISQVIEEGMRSLLPIEIPILYGGSVSPTTLAEGLERVVNGFLVGGASLDPDLFADLAIKYKG